MATSRRIVLVDALGEILFSGESMIAKETAAERCPETMRSPSPALREDPSGGSGTYRAVDLDEAGPATEPFDPDAEISTAKRGPRAA